MGMTTPDFVNISVLCSNTVVMEICTCLLCSFNQAAGPRVKQLLLTRASAEANPSKRPPMLKIDWIADAFRPQDPEPAF